MFVTEADLRDAGHGISTSVAAVFGTREARPVPAWVRDPVSVAACLDREAGGPQPRWWWATLAALLVSVADLTDPARLSPPVGVLFDAAEALRAALGPQGLAEPPTACSEPGHGAAATPCVSLLATPAARLADSLDAPWAADDDLAAQLEDLLDGLYDYAGHWLAAVAARPPSCGPTPPTLPTVRGAGARRQGRTTRRARASARPPGTRRPRQTARADSRGPPRAT